MDIFGLDRGEVLAALYNAARVVNPHADVGFLLPEKARILVSGTRFFGRLYGRNLLVDLAPDWLETAKYNRHNGALAAEFALRGVIDAHETAQRIEDRWLRARGQSVSGTAHFGGGEI